MSTTPDGGVSISGQGETSFPRLAGKVVSDHLLVNGYSDFKKVGATAMGRRPG